MSSSFFVFSLSFSACVSVAVGSFPISCSSRFTGDGTSFCVGIPVQCSVSLDPALCIDGEDNFTENNLDVSVFESGSMEPEFSFSQDGSLLTVIIDYVPETNMSIITVQLVATVSANCSFSASHTGTVRSSSSQCHYPLSFLVNRSEPVYPALVKGGDLIELALELVPDSVTLRRLSFSISASHPALALAGYEFASKEIGSIASMASTDGDPLVDSVRLVTTDTLFANITFRVQPYVQPGATLYFAFRVSYFAAGYMSLTFTQGFKFFGEYTAADVTSGNWTFSLHSYADTDRAEFTFPPNVDDTFSINIPITLPCVSTDLNVSITFPIFLSDNFTMFLTNITSISLAMPPNSVRVSRLCQYQEAGFTRVLCDASNLGIAATPPNIVATAVEGPGIDNVKIKLGPVLYRFTSPENCATNSSATNCTCEEEDIVIMLAGHVANDSIFCENATPLYPKLTQIPCGIFCENQTLADNVTFRYAYSREVTTERAPTQLDTDPSIASTIVTEHQVFPVNASMPAINVPINSFAGDAGDSYILTFGVHHDSEYSSFTAYDLNYTFSVEPHLEPEENITICFYNESSEPITCEEVPFINYTISRFGFHPE